MYILNWNPDSQTLEASLGGYITQGEAECFLEELRAVVEAQVDGRFGAVVDYAAVTRADERATELFLVARDTLKFAGADVVTVVARNDEELAKLTDSRLQEVLEGTERYFAYHIAA